MLLGTQGSIMLGFTIDSTDEGPGPIFQKEGLSVAYVTSDGDIECEGIKAGVLEGKYQLVFKILSS
jgi:hypothetical protein